MTAPRECTVVRSKRLGHLYLVYLVEGDRVKLVPYDADSKADGAKRTWTGLPKFWERYEEFDPCE